MPSVPSLPSYSFFRLRRFLPNWVTDVDWSHGMVRDAARQDIPNGALYNAVDFYLDKPGIAYKRGGTSYAGPAMTGATYAQNCIYADFVAGSQLLAVGDNGSLYKITSGTTTNIGSMGAAFVPRCKPVFHNGGTKEYVIIPPNSGATAFKKYNGSAISAAVASAPKGQIAAIYKSRLVLANDGTNKVRVWFSPVTVTAGADIDQTWDTTNAWVDADYPVVGMAALQNSLLIFSAHQTERLTGTTPPPGSDFDHAPVGSIGCTDARSITVWNNYAIFANSRSIFMTNGVGFKDLLKDAGMVTYWQSILTGYTQSGWTITTGLLWNSYLYVSVMNGSTFVDCLMCNLQRNTWWRLANIKSSSWTTAVDVKDELYYADRSTNRVVAMSGTFNPSSSNKNDADGTAVTPQMETRVLNPSVSIKTYGLGRLSFDMRDAATDNPTLAVSCAPGLEATTFTACNESPLPETTDETRKAVTFEKTSQGLTVRLVQSNASSKTEIYGLEAEIIGMGEEYGGQ